MRLAWFRATPPDSNTLLDRTAPLIDALRRLHTLDIITAAEAHDFVWKHGRQPYELCVYEIGSSPAQRFVHPYALHYPGVAVPTEATTPDPRLWSGSRMVVVADAVIAQSFASMWPSARLRFAPLGSDPGEGATQPIESPPHRGLTLGLPDPALRGVVGRAAVRARQRGAAVTVIEGPTAAVLRDADVLVVLEWPPTPGPPVAALHAMAAGRAVIALEVEATAGWPAWDPQTWQLRGLTPDPPIVVSVDPRDEEHSLVLAIVRLAADAPLRSSLAAAGHAWWQAHATVDHAVARWEAILSEAVTLGPAAPQAPADGSERARAILEEMGVDVDVLHS